MSVTPLTLYEGRKKYDIYYVTGSVSANTAFPSTAITVLHPGMMYLLISVSGAAYLQMTITLPTGQSQTSYLAGGNQLNANTWYYYEFPATPGMQIQFVSSAAVNVFIVMEFESQVPVA